MESQMKTKSFFQISIDGLRPSAHSRKFEKKDCVFIWDSIYRDWVCIIFGGQTYQIYHKMPTGRRDIHFTDYFMCELNLLKSMQFQIQLSRLESR